MGIESVNELATGRSRTLNEKNQRTYTRVFIVETDDPETDAAEVSIAVPIVIGDSYSAGTTTDAGARLKSKEANCTSEDGRTWNVTLEYGFVENEDTNPLNEPYKVSWSFQQFSKIVERDINGTAILNSAGDPYSEPVERDDSRPVLSITRNEVSFNPALAHAYRDAVNATAFFGASAGQVKVSNISADYQVDQEYGPYWTVTYEFHFDPQGFDKVILDQGYRQLVEGKKEQIYVQGVPAQDPVLLNGQGAVLPQGGQPVFRTHRVYQSLPFTTFFF